MLAHSYNLDDLIDTFNTEFCSLNAWLLRNKLTLNTKKTLYVVPSCSNSSNGSESKSKMVQVSWSNR